MDDRNDLSDNEYTFTITSNGRYLCHYQRMLNERDLKRAIPKGNILQGVKNYGRAAREKGDVCWHWSAPFGYKTEKVIINPNPMNFLAFLETY